MGELPSTSEYLKWCARNKSIVSKTSALRDIKQVAADLGVSLSEQPEHLKRKVALSPAAGKKVVDLYDGTEAVEDKQAGVMPAPKVRKLGSEIRAEVEKEFDEKYGKGWRSSVLKMDEVKAETIRRNKGQS
jgi:hypothetical protein